MDTVLASPGREVVIGHGRPFVVIGERINPSGRRAFEAQLRSGELDGLREDVSEQVAGGAMALDVNVGSGSGRDVDLMAGLVRAIQSLTDLPLVIDSSSADVLVAGLAAYEGKALVNSVSAADDYMEMVLPFVKRHGASVVCLPMDGEVVPERPEQRLEVARKLVAVATETYGIEMADLVIDPLATPILTGGDAALQTTLETITMVREELGLNTILGLSNVSFGLQERKRRDELGAEFIRLAIAHGLTSAICDARSPTIMAAVRTAVTPT